MDNGSTWTAATATAGQNTWSLSGQTLTASNTLKVRVTDAAGNNGTALSQAYVLDTTSPTTTVSTASFSADTGTSSTDLITNATAQTISGTLSANVVAGEVVYVSLDNGATWTAATTSVASNTWSLAGQTLTASNTLKIKVSDAAGNDGTVLSQAYTLDTSAPSAPSTPDMTSASDTGVSTDNITSNTTPTFTGTAEAGSTVTLYDSDGTTVLGTAVATGGNWSITSTALSAGAHTLTVKATDAAGNTSAASTGLVVTIDTATPTAIVLSNSSVSNTAGNNTAVGTLSSTDATVGDTFTYALVAGAGSTDNASFSISGNSLVATNPSALSAGSKSVLVRTTDVAGNSFEQTFSISVTSNQGPAVTTPTTIALTDTSSTDTFSNQTGTISATDADGIASYGIQGGTTGGSDSINGVTYDVSKAGTYGTLYVNSIGGAYVYVPNATAINARITNASENFAVTATDGNASPVTGTATLTVNITGANDTPTDLALSASTVNQSAGTNATVGTLSTTDVDTGETFTYTLVSGAGDTYNSLFNISGNTLRANDAANMAAGNYSVRVQTADASAGTYEEVLTITVVDSVAPTVSSVGVPANDDYTVGDVLDFTVNFSEVVIVNTTGGTPRIELTIGSTTVYAEYLSGSASNALTFRYTIQANDLDADGIALNALGLNGGTINDAAGNNATLTLNSVDPTTGVKVDAVDPSAPSTPNLDAGSDSGSSNTDNITSDNTPTFSGTAEAGSTVELYDGSTLIGSATAGVSGNWTITSAVLSNGSHTITAKATDAAGNASTVSSGLTITVDTAAPSAVSLDRNNVAETAATTGSTVAVLTATDASSVTFALSSGLGDANNGSFTIANGNLVAASNLSAGTYNVRVSATDAAGNVTYETFVITVSSNTAPAITSGASVTVVENAPSATTVYTATASDADAGQTLTFSLTGADAALFNLNASTGVVTLRNSANYEARSSYSFNVVVTDDGAGNLSDTKAVTVTVVDANDPATGALTVGGIPKQGETLTANDTLVDEDGINGKTYQWFADGLPINGANQSTFVLGQAQVGKAITVKVSYTDGAGRQEEFISAATASVATNVSGFSPAPVVSPQPVAPVITLVQAAPIEIVSPSVSSFFSSPVGGTIAMLISDPLISSVVMPWASDMPGQRAATGVVAVGVSPMAGTNFFGLRAIEASRDIVIERGEQASFTLPAGTFVHTDGNARVSLSARLADGRPLPSFVKFNPTTGTFTVEAGSGEQAEQLQVVVNAVDDKGQTASTTVVIKLKEKARTSSELDMQIKLGKPALVEQFRQADKPAGAMAELAALSKAFAASQLERSRA